jgi:uncharacterized coiled-coil protein SlyX
MAAESLEQRVADLEEGLAATLKLLRTLTSLVSQVSGDSYLGTFAGAPLAQRKSVAEDIDQELRVLRESLKQLSERFSQS